MVMTQIKGTFAASVQAIQNNLLTLIQKGGTLLFQWVPSHCNIQPNDFVDKAANDARLITDINEHIELVDLYRHVKSRQAVRWQTFWDLDKQETFLGNIKDKLGHWDWCRHANRFTDVIMTRFRLGKVELNKYLKGIKKSDTDLCLHCNSGDVEDIHHYLLHCTAFTDARQKLKDDLRRLNVHVMNINILLGDSGYSPQTKKRINDAMAKYILNSKRLVI